MNHTKVGFFPTLLLLTHKLFNSNIVLLIRIAITEMLLIPVKRNIFCHVGFQKNPRSTTEISQKVFIKNPTIISYLIE